MNPKRKILLFVDWYLPGYKAGGPIQSCANLVARLQNDFSFKVVTGNTDLDEVKPYPDVNSNVWNIRDEGTPVFYASPESISYRSMRSLMQNELFDVLYLNSFFSFPFTILPLLVVRLNHMKCKVVVAPRGMMGTGSLSIKPFKKKGYIYLVKAIGLFKHVTWHASTDQEAEEIKTVFGPYAIVRKAINLTAPRLIHQVNRNKISGHVRFFCLARVSPVKNVLAIFRYLQKVNPLHHFSMDIYGTLEDTVYVNQCRALASEYGKNIVVSFKGAINNKQVQEMASHYHFMILPTLNENFGHAIVESLVAGCPVLISNRTPWRNLEDINAGWDLPLENDGLFIEKLNLCASMDQVTYDSWSRGAYELAAKIVSDEQGTNQNRQLFLAE